MSGRISVKFVSVYFNQTRRFDQDRLDIFYSILYNKAFLINIYIYVFVYIIADKTRLNQIG